MPTVWKLVDYFVHADNRWCSMPCPIANLEKLPYLRNYFRKYSLSETD